MLADTIAAISTANGVAAIGIVRLSGPDAVRIGDGIFRSKRAGLSLANAPAYRMIHGVLTSQDGVVLDDCLAVVMRAPASYTGDDVVEFHCHGSPVILQAVMATLLAAGARAALAGEFTRRAFVNGKLDLVQVEAVGDLLTAQSEAGAELAVQQLGGNVSGFAQQLRQTLVGFLAHVHAAIDYPDEVPEPAPEEWVTQIEALLTAVEQLLQEAKSGVTIRTGVDAVLVGRPNVGKSSLLNALLRTSRAIVTEVPGTTRDVIEESISIAGVNFRLSDTAGLRETTDPVEMQGVERTRQKIAAADLILAVFDSSQPLVAEDKSVFGQLHTKQAIVVWNKSDLPPVLDAAEFAAWPLVRVSAVKGFGLNDLERLMAEKSGVTAARRQQREGRLLLGRPRQVGALQGLAATCRRVLTAIAAGVTPDILASELEAGLWHLGELTGETTPDEVVDEIFRHFCVGK